MLEYRETHMPQDTHRFRRFGGWREAEARLMYDSAESRRTALDQAEADEANAKTGSRNPEEELTSHTEKLAKQLEHMNESWVNSLIPFRRGHLAKKGIDALARQKLQSESAKWNGWLYRIMHWGERRVLLAQSKEQVTKDLREYLQKEKNEIFSTRQRFSRAASFIKRTTVPLSSKELKRKQRLYTLLGPIEQKFTRKADRKRGNIGWMEDARVAEEMVRTELLKGGLKEEAVEALLDANADGRSSLLKEIKGLKDVTGSLKRAVKKLRRYGRYRLLNAVTKDLNALPPKDRLLKADSDTLRSRTIEFDLGGKRLRTIVLKRKSPYLTLLDCSKGRGAQGSYLVLDTRDGVLLRREGSKEIEADLVRNAKQNTFRLPMGVRLAA